MPRPHGPSSPIPSIEIGSFVAVTPDRSEFIGSASGVFFANTVFRSFAKSAVAADAEIRANRIQNQSPVASSTPTTAPVHDLLGAAADEPHDDAQDGDAALDPSTVRDDAAAAAAAASASPATRSYGVVAPGLGAAPSSDVAKQLVMQYFRHWHAFFPFLHGPSFFQQISAFYEQDNAPTPESRGHSAASAGTRVRLCQAVVFQCVFNLGALVSHGHLLDPMSKIQSSSALLALLGTIGESHDLATLQSLVAAELYLIATMSLRAASTVNGIISRIIYHTGLHRCPFRYVGVPPEKCNIRKRIFWSAYVLDRSVSQLLGHPIAIHDSQVDVCIPGTPELHERVQPRAPATSSPDPVAPDDVRPHLPRDHPDQRRDAKDETNNDNDDVSHTGSSGHPGLHQTTQPGASTTFSQPTIQEQVLLHMVTFSRILGDIVDNFHQSIHARGITRDVIEDMVSRIHKWWNSLPQQFQDDYEPDEPSDDDRAYAVFFTVAYNYLLLIINRPFLSLPSHSKQMRSSLQVAITASRNIIQTLKRNRVNKAFLAWPVKLAAAWNSGLVLAFASLLNSYPFEKTSSQIQSCLETLDMMPQEWPSARHCRKALASLLHQLATRRHLNIPPNVISFLSQPSSLHQAQISSSQPQEKGESEPSNKRRRRDDARTSITMSTSNAWGKPPPQYNTPGGPGTSNMFPNNSGGWSNAPGMLMPVLEYNGPDFGFDSSSAAFGSAPAGPSSSSAMPSNNNSNEAGQVADSFSDIFLNMAGNPNSFPEGGLFEDAGWEAFTMGLGEFEGI